MPDSININIPEAIPVYPLKDMVAFPYMVVSLFIKEEDIPPFEESISYNNLIALVPDVGISLRMIDEDGDTCRSVRYWNPHKSTIDIEMARENCLRISETANLRRMSETMQPEEIPNTMEYPGWRVLRLTNWVRSQISTPISTGFSGLPMSTTLNP